MRLPFFSSSASALLGIFLLGPAFAQHPSGKPAAQLRSSEVPLFAVVETIEFKDVPQETQKLVLDRIGVRPGDTLTVEARHRIGRELGKVQKGLTFTFKPGSKPATAKLVISSDC